MNLKIIVTVLFIIFVSVSCAPITTPIPTSTAVPTLTTTPAPTATKTKASIRTATPQRELTIEDVGLPIDTTQVTYFKYKSCYLFTTTLFHAGDIINFTPKSPNSYKILAPVDGEIISANLVTAQIGWEINVMTDFLYEGQRVFYDIVHTNGLVDGVSVGTKIKKGEVLAIIKQPYILDPGGFTGVDFALRNSSHKQANPNSSNWEGTEYIPFSIWVLDDLTSLPDGTSYIDASYECHGKPIPEAKQTPLP